MKQLLTSGATRQLLLLTFAAFTGAYAWSALSPLQESIRISLRLSDNDISLLQGPALAAPMAISAIPLGLLIDRYSRKRLMLILAVINLLGQFLTARGLSFGSLFSARALIGLSVPALNTTIFSWLGDLYPAAQRGRARTVIDIGQYAGASLAFALGGMLVQTQGATSQGWRAAMLWMTVPLIPTLFLVPMMRDASRSEVATLHPSLARSFQELWQWRHLLIPLIAGLAVSGMAGFASRVWAGPALSRAFGFSPQWMGNVMGIAVLASGILGPILGGFLADYCQNRGGVRRTLLFLTLTTGLSAPLGLYAVAPNPLCAVILLMLSLTLTSAILVMGGTVLTVAIPNELRGVCMSITVAGQMVFGVGLAPPLVSLLAGHAPGPAAIAHSLAIVCIAVCIAGTLGFAASRATDAKFVKS